MSNNAGTYLQAARLNWMRTAAAYPSPPANTYVALWTTAPSAGGSGGVEVSGGSYARLAIPAADWGSPSGTSPTTISANTQLSFPQATADWGTIVAATLMDASSGGNLLEVLSLFPQRYLYNGDTWLFAAGNLQIQENGVSTYLQAARCNWFLGVSYPTALSTVYLALFTTIPGLNGSGGVEVSGGGYFRIPLASGGATWNAITGTPDTLSNNAILTFPMATANWGTVVAAGIYDAASSGNLLWLASLTASENIQTNDIFAFLSSTLSIQED